MEAPTEVEVVATRAIAKRLVAELKDMPWHKRGNESECAAMVAKAVKREAGKHGVSELRLKSYMMRIQRGWM